MVRRPQETGLSEQVAIGCRGDYPWKPLQSLSTGLRTANALSLRRGCKSESYARPGARAIPARCGYAARRRTARCVPPRSEILDFTSLPASNVLMRPACSAATTERNATYGSTLRRQNYIVSRGGTPGTFRPRSKPALRHVARAHEALVPFPWPWTLVTCASQVGHSGMPVAQVSWHRGFHNRAGRSLCVFNARRLC